MSCVAILGGSFNPLHVGHLRLAIEVHEAFRGQIDRVELLPTAHPPHKAEKYVLPFDIRVDLIREAAAPYPWLFCNPLEGERTEPSYTWDTLGLLAAREPDRHNVFVIGSQDYVLLPTWHHGLELPERCSLLVTPRGFYKPRDFVRDTLAMWPDAAETAPLTKDGLAMSLGRGQVLFQPLPWLEVSASLIRERWLAGRCVDYLVPRGVVRMLEERREEIRTLWT